MLRKLVARIKKIFHANPITAEYKSSPLMDAISAWNVAKNHFDNCEPDYISTAIFELQAAEYRLDAARRCVG